MPALYYFPGYGGGPHSTTYQALLAEFPETKVLLYDNENAESAFTQLKEQLRDVATDALFIGQSLGGFWAHHFALLHNQKALLINPSFRPFESLRKYGLSEEALTGFRKYDRPDILREPPTVILSKEDTVVNPAPVFERYKGKARFIYVEGGHRFRHYDVLFREIREIQETERLGQTA